MPTEPMCRSLPKKKFLRKPWQYRDVYARGQRFRGNGFSLICLPTDRSDNRIGISVHGVKRAVRRNRIKRIIREFFRLNRECIEPAVDMVFAVRPDFALDSPQAVAQAVDDLFSRHDPMTRPPGAGRVVLHNARPLSRAERESR